MLNTIINWSINNKLIVAILTFSLITWGLYSLNELPIDAVPDITNNQIQIVTSSPSSGAEDIERFVTFPVEQTMATIPGIEEIRSFSRFGLSVVTVVFSDITDIYWARQQVSERLSEAKNQIPEGYGEPAMAPLSTGLGEIYQYIIKPKKGFEKQFDATELRTIEDWIIRRQLLGVQGVADVSSFGGKLKQYEIALDLIKLKSLSISVNDVFNAIAANNQNTGGAYIEKNSSVIYIRTDGLMKNISDIENTVLLHNETGNPVKVKDIAKVSIGSAIRYGALTSNADGEAVGGIVLMLKGANAAKVIQLVKDRMEQIKQTLPEGVTVEVYLDRTQLVNRAMSTVTKNLLEGALIVISLLVLLLGNFRAGLIVASMIPLAMLFAIALMNIFGVSGNLMSLGALDFGLIIDGSVIIVESIIHSLKGKDQLILSRKQMDEKVYTSASKFSKSAVFGQVIILVVYLPLLALVGIEGKMFKPMAQTVMFAIIGALILSVTYLPMVSSLFLSRKISTRENISDKIIRFIRKVYIPLLNFVLRKQFIVLSGLMALLVSSVILFRQLGAEFIPSLDEGDFAVEMRLMTGTSLTKTIDATQKAADLLLKKFPEVKQVVGKIGTAEIPTDPMPMEACDLMIILKDKEEWVSATDKNELAEKMQKALEFAIPGISFGFQQPIQMRFNELMTGAKQDVVIKVYGEDLNKLPQYANQIGKLASKISGVQDVYVEEVSGLPQLIVKYNRVAMAQHNISVEQVNQAVNISFAGQSAGLIFEGERRFEVVVKLDSNQRYSMTDLKAITVTSPKGNQIPVSQLAEITYEKGPNQIQRDDAKRRIIIGFNVRGRDIASTVDELKKSIDNEVKFESGYYPTYGGTFKNLENARQRLAIAVPVALLMIFFLLFLTFQSIKQAVLIYTAIPMAAIGGVLAIFFRDMPFSISVGVGFIALFGVAVLNGIVLISEFNILKKQGYTNSLRIVLIGTRTCLRPVLLTTLVAAFGFLPMALSHGSGAEVQKPLATVVIGGLITATILTLFILPIFYLISEKKRKKTTMKNFIMLMVILLPSIFYSQNKYNWTLEECLNYSKENNASLLSYKIQIDIEKQIGASNFVMPKTNLLMILGQNNSYYRGDNNFALSQTIPFPTINRIEKELGTVKADQAAATAALTGLNLNLNIEEKYDQLQYLHATQACLKQQDSLYQLEESKTAFRKSIQESTKLDLILIANKRRELQNQINLLGAEIEAHEVELGFLIGSEIPIGIIVEPYDVKSLPLIDTTEWNTHPSISYFNIENEVLDAEQKRLKAYAMPELTLGYQNQSLTGLHSVDGVNEYLYTASDRFHSAQIGIDIPLFYGSTKRKLATLDLYRQQNDFNKSYLTTQLKSGLIAELLKYNSYRDAYDLYNSELLIQSDEITKQANVLMQTGEISMIDFIQMKQFEISTKLDYLSTIHAVNQSQIKLMWYIKK